MQDIDYKIILGDDQIGINRIPLFLCKIEVSSDIIPIPSEPGLAVDKLEI